jgi:hypothetical protein
MGWLTNNYVSLLGTIAFAVVGAYQMAQGSSPALRRPGMVPANPGAALAPVWRATFPTPAGRVYSFCGFEMQPGGHGKGAFHGPKQRKPVRPAWPL